MYALEVCVIFSLKNILTEKFKHEQNCTELHTPMYPSFSLSSLLIHG